MKYRQLGSASLVVSPVCLGFCRCGMVSNSAFETKREMAPDALDAAGVAGINFDEATTRSGDGRNAQWVGNWLAGRPWTEFVRPNNLLRCLREIPRPSVHRMGIRSGFADSLDRLGGITDADDEVNA